MAGRAAARARGSRSSGSRRREGASRRRGARCCATCLRRGLSLENGLHEFLTDDPELTRARDRSRAARCATSAGAPEGLDCPTGANLDVDARIVLTVGSDCAIGKMTVALELDREAHERGIASVFVPTGQTGIAIAGWGISVDAVVADFIAGAAERLVVEGRARGGELLLVEGQGSLSHPAYSGVTLGLLHGSTPHALVLCHQRGRDGDRGLAGPPAVLPLRELVELHERIALPRARPGRLRGAQHGAGSTTSAA